jgi:hypothetical protein
MCQAISAAKKQEQKNRPLIQAEWKKFFLIGTLGFEFYQTFIELDYPGFADPMESVVFRPAVPPPRVA